MSFEKLLPCFLDFPEDDEVRAKLLQYRVGPVRLAGISYWIIPYFSIDRVRIILFEALPALMGSVEANARPEVPSKYYYRLQNAQSKRKGPFGQRELLIANVLLSDGPPTENRELPWYGLHYIRGWQALTEIRRDPHFVTVLGEQVQSAFVEGRFTSSKRDEEFFVITRSPISNGANIIPFVPNQNKKTTNGDGKIIRFPSITKGRRR